MISPDPGIEMSPTSAAVHRYRAAKDKSGSVLGEAAACKCCNICGRVSLKESPVPAIPTEELKTSPFRGCDNFFFLYIWRSAALMLTRTVLHSFGLFGIAKREKQACSGLVQCSFLA